jgi:hypothetical protein
MRNAVMRMLSKDPLERWVSMEEASLAMGARPLARDDPTRSQLITLARSGAGHRIVSQMRTPQSPIPRSQRRGTKPLGAPAKPRWRPVLLAAGAMALLGAGYLLARFGAPDVAIDTPSVVSQTEAGAAKDPVRADSTLPPPAQREVPSQSPPANLVREPDRTSTSPQRSATKEDSKVSTEAPASKTTPQPALPNAAAPGSVGVLRTPAADSVAQLPTSPTVRTVPLPDASRPPTVAAPTVDEQAQVRGLILAFARAIGASDLATMRRLYPGMPNEQREGYVALWREGTLTPRWTISDIVVDDSVATARVQGTNVVMRRGAVSEVPVSLRARLERRGGEWRLVALVN